MFKRPNMPEISDKIAEVMTAVILFTSVDTKTKIEDSAPIKAIRAIVALIMKII